MSAGGQKISVTPEFQAAARVLGDGEHLLVLGSAGTGKSTFLRYIKKLLNGGGNMPAKRYAVLAPTGMAALNVGGQTIHSFFGFKAGPLGHDKLPRARQPKLYQKLDVLIVDEISMVRADMFDTMDAFLRKYGPAKGKPFGGVQLCLIGDLFQLPPVVTRDDAWFLDGLYASPYFFSSPAFQHLPIRVVEFTKIFRQADVPFIQLLSDIRHNRNVPETLRFLNERVMRGGENVAHLPTLTARVATADKVNQEALENLPGREFIYAGALTDGFDEKALPSPKDLVLKVGARVMFTKNDSGNGGTPR